MAELSISMRVGDDSWAPASGWVRQLLNSAHPEKPQHLVTVLEGRVNDLPRSGMSGLVIYLSPWWHRTSGEIAVEPVRVRLPNSFRVDERLAPGNALRIYCRDLEQPRRGSHTWTATGMEIDASRADVPPQVPVLVHDRLLNRVILDPRTNTFIGQRNRGRLRFMIRIERSITVDDDVINRRDVLRAAGIVQNYERQADNVRTMVARRVRVLYHEQWRHGRRHRSIAEVAATLQLSELTTTRNGGILLQLHADDLFYGHWIEVALDPALGLVTVRVAP
jgi:hypothetical protein